jgi:hypothetical protein
MWHRKMKPIIASAAVAFPQVQQSKENPSACKRRRFAILPHQRRTGSPPMRAQSTDKQTIRRSNDKCIVDIAESKDISCSAERPSCIGKGRARLLC